MLQFAAALKCSEDPEVRKAKIEAMLSELELVHVRNVRVGGTVKGLSLRKGEKKRLSIAVELITNPALVFMDEPTTGMDTFTAEKIIEIINKLAAKGRTIICTIHQPNTEIYKSLDLLMLLSYGKVIYNVCQHRSYNSRDPLKARWDILKRMESRVRRIKIRQSFL